MYYDLVKTELLKQKEVYLALKAGRRETVCYQAYQDPVYGTQDANYTNRLRLAYYMLYEKVDDEEVTAWLFGEELKDREENSFQGIGTALEILTFLLKKYNAGHLYDDWFVRAKKANFDCACGYDADLAMCEELSDQDLLDCIYLCQDMEFKTVMEPLVEQWKASVAEWNDSKRTTLIRFYSFLEKDSENEMLYLEQLVSAKRDGKAFDVVSAYSSLIRYYLDVKQLETAHQYLDEVRRIAEYKEIRRRRLLGDLLEEGFEIICQEQTKVPETCRKEETGQEQEVKNESCRRQEKTSTTEELWGWAKKELKSWTNWYGNLYKKGIAAAKAMGDSYAAQLEKEYQEWWNQCFL